MANSKVEKRRGYLNEDFRFFHLKNNTNEQFDYHYHEFYKMIVFVSGKVTYLIEGQSYALQPWDTLMITGHDIHRPLIDPDIVYDRFVIWFKPTFLLKNSYPGSNLLTCFEVASEKHQYLLRLQPEALPQIQSFLNELENSNNSTAFGSKITKNATFLLLTVLLNRLSLETDSIVWPSYIQYDETITRIIDYLQHHLAEDLRIESLAEQFFLSKYSLMHKFKQQTGYSIHNFILQKRLLAAHEFIKKGYPYMEASSRSGFSDYSCFVRAFTKYFGLSPRKYFESRRLTD